MKISSNKEKNRSTIANFALPELLPETILNINALLLENFNRTMKIGELRMKTFRIVILVFLMCNLGLEGKELRRVMFYNTENFFDFEHDLGKSDKDFLPDGVKNWNSYRYWRKISQLSKVIAAVGEVVPPVLVGMCEVENDRCLKDLTAKGALKRLGYQFIHFESPDARGVDVALLYLPEELRLIKSEPLTVKFLAKDSRPTRDILYASFQTRKGDSLHVFVCHLPSRLGGEQLTDAKRKEAAKVVRNKVDTVLKEFPGQGIVIMGDMNDYPENSSMKEVLRAYSPQIPFFRDSLYNMTLPLHYRGEGSHKYETEWGVLDQIIVNGRLLPSKDSIQTGWINNSAEGKIFKADFLLTDDIKYMGVEPLRTYNGMQYLGGFSDHLPVFIDFFEE